MTDVRARVVCLPYSGGSGFAYRQWPPLGDGVDVLPLDYPGHPLRPDEPLKHSVPDLVADLTEALRGVWDKPFALCGTSLGALVAFELARVAEAAGRAPAVVVLAACAAPSRLPRHPPVSDRDDEAFLAAIAGRYGGAAVGLAADPDARDWLLPALRADIRAFETYRGAEAAPIAADLIVASGQDDGSVGFGDVAAWRSFTTGTCRVLSVPGDHFFLLDQPHEVVGELGSRLRTGTRP
ncbi:thioesterase II family protein [Amycolatopsis sp. cmx-4-83]|uniref:thioesterase II family protein n=1 Tax=Amycolatopsis sp. cmx-4-83 TaxID=2790940 RepID=UPI00397938C5